MATIASLPPDLDRSDPNQGDPSPPAFDSTPDGSHSEHASKAPSKPRKNDPVFSKQGKRKAPNSEAYRYPTVVDAPDFDEDVDGTVVDDPDFYEDVDGQDEEDEYDEEDDKNKREQFLKQGEEEMKRTRMQSKGKYTRRPDEVEKLWRQGYPLVRKWWSGKVSEEHKKSLRKIDEAIMRYCTKRKQEKFQNAWPKKLAELRLPGNRKGDDKEQEKEEEQARKNLWAETGKKAAEEMYQHYQFPSAELEGQILGIGAKLKEIEDLSSSSAQNRDQRLKEEKAKLIEGVAIFQEKIKDLNVDPRRIVSEVAMRAFEEFINKKDSKEVYDRFLVQLKQPTVEEGAILEKVAPKMRRFMKLVGPDIVATDRQELAKILKEVQGHNSDLGKHEVACRHDLCIGKLNQIKAKKISGSRLDDEHIQQLMRQIVFRWGQQGLNAQAETVFEGIIDVDKVWEEGPKYNPESTNPRPTEKSESPKSHPKTARSQTPRSESDLEYTEDDGSVEMPPYNNGITEYGMLVSTRRCKTENPRFNRYIVNAGTEKRPFFRVVKGSDLGPGGAEQLDQDEEKYVTFDLAQRKKAMKQAAAQGLQLISRLGPCVELEKTTSEGPSKAKSGGDRRYRRRDLYIRVNYNNSISDNCPPWEWLSRTESQQLLGQKYVNDKEPVMMAKRKVQEAFFAQCKARMRHPDTNEPLTAEDRNEQPWLFPLYDEGEKSTFYYDEKFTSRRGGVPTDEADNQSVNGADEPDVDEEIEDVEEEEL